METGDRDTSKHLLAAGQNDQSSEAVSTPVTWTVAQSLPVLRRAIFAHGEPQSIIPSWSGNASQNATTSISDSAFVAQNIKNHDLQGTPRKPSFAEPLLADQSIPDAGTDGPELACVEDDDDDDDDDSAITSLSSRPFFAAMGHTKRLWPAFVEDSEDDDTDILLRRASAVADQYKRPEPAYVEDYDDERSAVISSSRVFATLSGGSGYSNDSAYYSQAGTVDGDKDEVVPPAQRNNMSSHLEETQRSPYFSRTIATEKDPTIKQATSAPFEVPTLSSNLRSIGKFRHPTGTCSACDHADYHMRQGYGDGTNQQSSANAFVKMNSSVVPDTRQMTYPESRASSRAYATWISRQFRHPPGTCYNCDHLGYVYHVMPEELYHLTLKELAAIRYQILGSTSINVEDYRVPDLDSDIVGFDGRFNKGVIRRVALSAQTPILRRVRLSSSLDRPMFADYYGLPPPTRTNPSIPERHRLSHVTFPGDEEVNSTSALKRPQQRERHSSPVLEPVCLPWSVPMPITSPDESIILPGGHGSRSVIEAGSEYTSTAGSSSTSASVWSSANLSRKTASSYTSSEGPLDSIPELNEFQRPASYVLGHTRPSPSSRKLCQEDTSIPPVMTSPDIERKNVGQKVTNDFSPGSATGAAAGQSYAATDTDQSPTTEVTVATTSGRKVLGTYLPDGNHATGHQLRRPKSFESDVDPVAKAWLAKQEELLGNPFGNPSRLAAEPETSETGTNRSFESALVIIDQSDKDLSSFSSNTDLKGHSPNATEAASVQTTSESDDDSSLFADLSTSQESLRDSNHDHPAREISSKPLDDPEVSNSSKSFKNIPDTAAERNEDVNFNSDTRENFISVVPLDEDTLSTKLQRSHELIELAQAHIKNCLIRNERFRAAIVALAKTYSKQEVFRSGLVLLFKQFHLYLTETARTPTERDAARLMTSQPARIRLAEEVSNHFYLDGPSDADIPDLPRAPDLVRRLETWVQGLATRDGTMLDSRPALNRTEKFMFESVAFQRLLFQIRLHTVRQEHAWICTDLMTIPGQNISNESFYAQSWRESLQLKAESFTQCHWNWWPLSTPRESLDVDMRRLNWTCHCGHCFYADVSNEDFIRIDAFLKARVQPLGTGHLCHPNQLGSRPNPSDHSQVTRTSANSLIDSKAWSVVRPNAGNNPSNNSQTQQPPPTSISQGSPASSNSSPNNPATIVSSSTTIPNSGQPATSGQSIAPAPQILRKNPRLRLIFGHRKSSIDWSSEEVNMVKDKLGNYIDDCDVFDRLIRECTASRGSLAEWLSPLQLGWFTYQKFRKFKMDKAFSCKAGHPSRDKDYVYITDHKPPGNTPLDKHQFQYALARCRRNCWRERWQKKLTSLGINISIHECDRLDKQDFVHRVPKKKEQWLGVKDDREAWGLQTALEIILWRVFMYHVVFLIPAYIAWGLWMRWHSGDLQGAAVMISVYLGSISCLWQFLQSAGISLGQGKGKMN